MRLLIKYCTSFPTSAAMEGLHNEGADVSLRASNFEQLISLKSNLNSVEFPEDEEEQ